MNSNELVIQDDFSKQLEELQNIQATCTKLLQTKHYASMGEAGIHAIIARSKSLGLHPFEALNGLFFCINGRVGMSTETMAALIRRKGHSITKDPKSTNECIILHGKRSDNGDTWTCSFSKEDAITAGLWGTATWKKYPGVMLYNRCMSMLFRQLFPDLSLGAGYVEDELKEITKTGDYQKPSVSESPKANASKISKVSEKPMTIEVNKNDQEIISKENLMEVTSLLEEKPDDFVANVWKWLNSMGISSLDQMNNSVYRRLVRRIEEINNSGGI